MPKKKKKPRRPVRVDGLGTAHSRPADIGKLRELPASPQVYRPIRCPECGADQPSVRATFTRVRYCECHNGHRFKVGVER